MQYNTIQYIHMITYVHVYKYVLTVLICYIYTHHFHTCLATLRCLFPEDERNNSYGAPRPPRLGFFSGADQPEVILGTIWLLA